jgi:hypothetical protein
MENYRRIIADKTLGLSVLVTFAVLSSACPSTVKPVDTSQRILIEIAQVTSDVDQAVADHMPQAQDRARETVMERINAQRLERHDCIQRGSDPDSCVDIATEEQAIEMYEAELLPWNRLVTSLVAMHGTLRAWEQINDEWRESGTRPTEWDEMVCEPLGTLSNTILDLLIDVGVPVADRWRTIIRYVDPVCSIVVDNV